MKKISKILLNIVIVGVIGLVIVGLLIQLVPYGRSHVNPPVVKEPNWDTPKTRIIAKKACFDCHSNETVWPWYSNIAPASWLIQRDVDEGRQTLNFSDWGNMGARAGEILEVVSEGRMPPIQYVLLHRRARISGQQLQQFIQGLTATFSNP